MTLSLTRYTPHPSRDVLPIIEAGGVFNYASERERLK